MFMIKICKGSLLIQYLDIIHSNSMAILKKCFPLKDSYILHDY